MPTLTESYLAVLEDQEAARSKWIAQRWAAYRGDLPKPLRVRIDDYDDNQRLNYAGLIVEKTVATLFGQGVDFEEDLDEREGETERSGPEQLLDAFWLANRKEIALQNLGINGGVCGHAWLRLYARDGAPPQLIVMDPESVSAYPLEGDIDTLAAYKVQWVQIDEQGRPEARRQLIEPVGDPMRPASWTIREQAAKVTDRRDREYGVKQPLFISSFRTSRWVEVGRDTWPHPFPPLIGCQNQPAPNEVYGRSDIDDYVVELNNGLNFTISNLARIIRYHAHPKTWGRGLPANLDVSVDSTLNLGPSGELHNLEMTSDLSASIELYARQKEALHEIARIPEIATGKVDNVGALSGVALRILYGPLIELVGSKQKLYGEMLSELCRRAVAMMGGSPEVRFNCVWPPTVPGDEKVAADTATVLHNLGVSRDTLLKELGYDAEKEKAKREAETAESMEQERQRMEIQSNVGEALLTKFERGG